MFIVVYVFNTGATLTLTFSTLAEANAHLPPNGATYRQLGEYGGTVFDQVVYFGNAALNGSENDTPDFWGVKTDEPKEN